jgi:hypothetical protein
VQIHEGGRRDPLTLSNQTEEEVFGANEFVVEARALLSRQREDLSHSLREVVTIHFDTPGAALLDMPLEKIVSVFGGGVNFNNERR